MKTSELITALTEAIREHGDLDVWVIGDDWPYQTRTVYRDRLTKGAGHTKQDTDVILIDTWH